VVQQGGRAGLPGLVDGDAKLRGLGAQGLGHQGFHNDRAGNEAAQGGAALGHGAHRGAGRVYRYVEQAALCGLEGILPEQVGLAGEGGLAGIAGAAKGGAAHGVGVEVEADELLVAFGQGLDE